MGRAHRVSRNAMHCRCLHDDASGNMYLPLSKSYMQQEVCVQVINQLVEQLLLACSALDPDETVTVTLHTQRKEY